MSDKDIRLLIRRYSFYLLTVDGQLQYTRGSYFRLLLIFSILPIAQTVGSYYDNALFLDGDDRGLLEHYGQWSVFLAPPLLVYLASLALKKIAVAARDLATYSVKGEVPTRAKETVGRHLGYFDLKGKWIKLYFLSLIVVGAAVSVVNFLQTANPVKAFGNYTFDSIKYAWGFLFTRISNTLLYTLVFPVLIFEILLITFMLVRLLRAMVEEGSLYIDFFNADECGGMSTFGFINVLIMLFWVVVFCIILCDFMVQKEVATTLVISAVFCSTLFIVQSVWGVYSIHTCVQSKKTETLAEIEEALKTITAGELQVNTVLKYIMAGEVSLERIPPVMQLRELVRSTRTVPYTRNAAIAVNTMRIAPPVMAVIRLLT